MCSIYYCIRFYWTLPNYSPKMLYPFSLPPAVYPSSSCSPFSPAVVLSDFKIVGLLFFSPFDSSYLLGTLLFPHIVPELKHSALVPHEKDCPPEPQGLFVIYNLKEPLCYVFENEKVTGNGTEDYKDRKDVFQKTKASHIKKCIFRNFPLFYLK